MKTESLPVKYRPKRFADYIGQDRIVAELGGMFKRGTVNNSFMIVGPSGLGKTTLARLIARSINCENFNVEKMRPCGKCRSCQLQNHPDVIEMNFAIKRGIDDVRSVVAQSQNRPMLGKKKVFILDECFPAGTQVLTSVGYVPIENLSVGTYVLSRNESSGEIQSKEVTNTFDRGVRKLIRVHLEDGSHQDCTPEHKWWSVTRGAMVKAIDLQDGEELLALPLEDFPTDE